jgi:hypothetical protein
MVLTVINFPVFNLNILGHGRLCFACVHKTIKFTGDDFVLQGCFASGIWLPAFRANKSRLTLNAINLSYVLCLKFLLCYVQETAL